ncbi:MAG TPA: ABC transporter permease, partial [Firmicutes bacterium]|nr:ABC transporter permease [Bacillota bacterium]
MRRSVFAQWKALGGFTFRQERLRLAAWFLALILLNVLVVVTYTELYQNDLERQAMAETMRNPAMIS